MKQASWQMVLVVGLLGIITGIVAFVFYFLFFDKPYLEYRNIPFPSLVKQVRPGDVIPLSVERCNHDSVTRNYVTSHSLEEVSVREYIILPDVQVSATPGCSSSISMINKLPDTMPHGFYRVIGTAAVRGALRYHYVDWKSEVFEVVPR